jgi:hypothetical protein
MENENIKVEETKTEEIKDAEVIDVPAEPKKKFLQRKPVKVVIGIAAAAVGVAGAFLFGKDRGHKETMSSLDGYSVKVDLTGAKETEETSEETE